MNKQQAWFQGWPVEKIGGPGSGWFAPPRGTHVSAVTGKTAARMRAELKRDYKRKMDRMDQLQAQVDQYNDEQMALNPLMGALYEKKHTAEKAGNVTDLRQINKKIDALQAKRERVWMQGHKAQNEYYRVRNSIREGAREKLKVANPAEFKTNMGKLRKGREDLQQGSNAFASMMGRGTLDNQTVTMHTTGGNRGHYSGNGVYLPPINRRSKVVVHELGHWLEDRDSNVHTKALAFLKKRTRGERAIPLSRATGNTNYRAYEMTKKDKFMHPYSGKIYKGGYATEIISMGVEHLYSEPIEFATKDPEYFDFMYNLMRGE